VFFLSGWAIPILMLVTISGFSGENLNLHNPPKIVQVLNPSPTSLPTPTPTLSPIPSPTPTATPSPTITPTPTKTIVSPTKAPVESAPVVSSGDTALELMKQINDFRAGKGLGSFSTDGYTCSFAVTRAKEIESDFSHSGFRNRIDGKSLPYPSFTGISENIAMNSDPNAVVQGWIDSPGHNENLSNSHAHACVGKSGNNYAFESWNP